MCARTGCRISRQAVFVASRRNDPLVLSFFSFFAEIGDLASDTGLADI